MSAASVFSAGSSAVISGAASGIGLAIGQLCYSKGMNVMLIDRNAAALEKAKASFTGGQSKVETAEADVSNTKDWEKLVDTAKSSFGSVELLVLNAGTTAPGGWGDESYFRTVLETNLFGVINGINSFLPSIKEAAGSKPTSVVITGSKQGITNPPGNPAYNCSKAAVKSLAEQLSYELKGTQTSVHLLVPGWTFTGLTGGVEGKEKPAGAWSAGQVADYLYEKMSADQFYIICPDNDVTEETDKKRMQWSVGDVISGRPPLSRWRPEFAEQSKEAMAKMNL